MIGGYTGKVIKVNLTEGEIKTDYFKEEVLRKYIGGSGLGAKYLYEMTDEKTDPLGPDNPLIFMTGPFTGTKVPMSGRHEIISKSPLTGIYGESDAGGRWGLTLKKAGFDGIIFEGIADTPKYVFIENEKIEILDGREVWGLDTYQTDTKLKEIHGNDCVVSCIGPAGERKVPLAGIFHDGKDARAAGRAGLGAVMGSKKLKAIVVKGNGEVPVIDRDALMESVKKLTPGILDKTKSLSMFGTAGGVIRSESIGDLPIKNWKQGNWESVEKISGQRMAETILKKKFYCGACAVGCGRDIEINTGPYAGVNGSGPEYETLGLLGSNCMIDDIEAVAYLAELCNRYGTDTISTGAVIAFGMELYENGLITKEDLDGVELTWGNARAAAEIIKKIAYKEGFGEILGSGVKKTADKIGGLAHEYAIHVKGLELPAHDPRAFNSLGLGYATSNRGACHVQGSSYFFEKTAIMPEVGINEPLDRLSQEGKAELNFHSQNIMCLMDSLKLCKFIIYGGINLTNIAHWINYVIGWDISVGELLETGERIFNLKRMYNVREGISRKDDMLPPRILSQPRRDTGTGKNLPNLGKMLNEYYEIRGWTDEGLPKEETLRRLGLIE